MNAEAPTTAASETSKALPDRAQVIVVGGGIMGASMAYNLTKVGVTDVLVLEKHQLTGGTTWHAAGLVAQLRATENLTRLAQHSRALYKDLEAETGQATGYREPGSISVASNPARMEELMRTAAMARYLGVEAEAITPSEIQEKFPLCAVDDLVGGVWVPRDGRRRPVRCHHGAGARRPQRWSDHPRRCRRRRPDHHERPLHRGHHRHRPPDRSGHGRAGIRPLDPPPRRQGRRSCAVDGSRASLRGHGAHPGL